MPPSENPIHSAAEGRATLSLAERPPEHGPTAPACKRRGREPRRIAVALHDIEPATFERCALIRDWLDDHGVDRVTLLVIPARDLHPLAERSPEMTAWLIERQRLGDSIAQHGFRHEQLRRGGFSGRSVAHRRAFRAAEFVGLDKDETRRVLDAGRRVLKLAGLEPGGFVAPAYAYTPALSALLPSRFRWWASLLSLHHPLAIEEREQSDPRRLLAPAWGVGTDGRLRRLLSPTLIRAGSLLCGQTMRLDLHPADVQFPRYMMALEWILGRDARRRQAITYDELIAATPALPAAPTSGLT